MFPPELSAFQLGFDHNFLERWLLLAARLAVDVAGTLCGETQDVLLLMGASGGPVERVLEGYCYLRKMEVLMGKPEENHRKMEVYPLVN